MKLTAKQRATLETINKRLRERERTRYRFREAGDPGKPPGYTAWAGHHYYWGFIAETIGFVLIFESSPWWALPFILVGLHWNIDDVMQHIHQGHDFLWWKANPSYISPVHIWYWAVVTWPLSKAKPNTAWWRLLMWLRRH